MATAILRVSCASPGCAASVALFCATILPRSWGESIGNWDENDVWHPSLFWCPAHKEGVPRDVC
jgi:hypothetical protein